MGGCALAVRLLSTLPPPALGRPAAAPGCPLPVRLDLGGARTLHSPVSACAQDTPDPWQGLDPFDSPDSKPFRKGNAAGTAPGHQGVGAGLTQLLWRLGLQGLWARRRPWAVAALRDCLSAPR